MTCTIESCDKPAAGRGWCRKHYMRWYRHGDPLGVAPAKPIPTCSVIDCDLESKSLGMCRKHYDAERYRLNSRDEQWREARRVKNREQWTKHRTKRLREMRDYYAQNSELLKLRAAENRRLTGRSELSTRARKTYAKRLQHYRETKRISRIKRRARVAGNGAFDVTEREIERLLRTPCVYCGTTATPRTIDHIIPIARGGRHSIGNLASACESCNKSKRDSLPVAFRRRLANVK